MRNKKACALCIALALILQLSTVTSFAASKTSSWSYSNDNYGTYVPRSGNMKASTYKNDMYYIKTKVTMTFTSANASSIALYNQGSTSSKVHEKCRGKKTYLTCDVSSVRNSGFKDYVNAVKVYSTLPNPKYDMENDNPATSTGVTGDYYNEESETVALGKITAKTYTMETDWADWRNSTSASAGKFQCQFGMSKKGVSDYNTVIISSAIQATINYSGTRASL